LWNQLDKKESQALNSLSDKPEKARIATLPYLKPASNFVQINARKDDCIASTTASNIDAESLALLIQQLPQPRIRTAARRLGIADRVDGRYQRLGILRTQLEAKLKSQPMEVAQVLKGMKIQVSI
jgi:hypothetical protein